MMGTKTIRVLGNNIRNAVSLARRELCLNERVRVATLSGGEDSSYRATLTSGDVVEIQIAQRHNCEVVK